MSSIQSGIFPSNIDQKLAALSTSVVGVMFQNGGMEPPMHSSQVPIGSLFACIRSPPSKNTSKRPNMLEVDPTMRYISKTIGDDGGSLPCTPDQQSESDSEEHGVCPERGDALENSTRPLISRFMREFGEPSKAQRFERILSTMERVVDGLLEKHSIAYSGK